MLSNMQLSHQNLKQFRWAVHIAGFVAVIVLGYAGWRIQSSIQSSYADTVLEIERNTQLLREASRIEKQLEDSMRSRDDVAASFRSLRERVPVRLIDSDILQEIEKVVAACECKLNDFRPIGTQLIETSELKCSVRSFQLSMNGSYAALFAFARELEDLPYLVQFRKLHLAAPSDSRSGSRIELEIGILYAPEWGESELVSSDRA